jgi:hypothetical protein
MNGEQSVAFDAMGYSLVFLRRRPGQSWEGARKAARERDAESLPDPATWDRILMGAEQILGEVSVFVTDQFYELDHDQTGIQVLCNASDGVSITVPYGEGDMDADAVMALMDQLGRVVEEATGLQGYDPQLGLPLSVTGAHTDQSVGMFDTIAAMFVRRKRTARRARERQRTMRRPPQQDG